LIEEKNKLIKDLKNILEETKDKLDEQKKLNEITVSKKI